MYQEWLRRYEEMKANKNKRRKYMDIFKYDGEEFNKKLDEIFDNIDKEKLKAELIECGLVIDK